VKTKIFLSILSGFLVSLCFYPFKLPFFSFVAYVPLIFAVFFEKSYKRMLLYAWISVFTQSIISFYWIKYVSMEYGSLSNLTSILILIFFSLFTNFYIQIFVTIFYFLRKFVKIDAFFTLILLPLIFTFSEIIDPRIFNWTIGNSLIPYKYLVQSADILGVSGLSFFIYFVNFSLFFSFYKTFKTRRFVLTPVICSVLFFTLVFSYGFYRYKMFKNLKPHLLKLKVGLVQANIGNPVKLKVEEAIKLRKELNVEYANDMDLIYGKYEKLTKELVKNSKDVDIIIWPETAFPGYFINKSPLAKKALTLFKNTNKTFFIGTYYGKYIKEKWHYYNSILKLDKHSKRMYHKNILLPFGEYMPLANILKGLQKLVPAVGDFSRGSIVKPFKFMKNDFKVFFTPNICYEILKANFIRKTLKTPSNAIFNVTNDSWFKGYEPKQHLELSRIRAIEFRRPIIRSTNTGISAFIDLLGGIVLKSSENREENLVSDVYLINKDYKTFYFKYGFLFPYFIVIACLLSIIFRRKKNEIWYRSV
jgi:apolipoprotein N-acyltransferase